VNRSVNEELVLEGLAMGQRDGPFPRKGKTRSPPEDPFKSFAFPKEGQNSISPGGPLQKLCLSQGRAKLDLPRRTPSKALPFPRKGKTRSPPEEIA